MILNGATSLACSGCCCSQLRTPRSIQQLLAQRSVPGTNQMTNRKSWLDLQVCTCILSNDKTGRERPREAEPIVGDQNRNTTSRSNRFSDRETGVSKKKHFNRCRMAFRWSSCGPSNRCRKPVIGMYQKGKRPTAFVLAFFPSSWVNMHIYKNKRPSDQMP